MKGSFWLRTLFLVGVLTWAVMSLIPTFFNLKEESSYPLKSKINLGLDLQGGLYMVLGIDFNKVYRDEISSYARRMQQYLSDEEVEAKLGGLELADKEDPRHSLVFNSSADVEKAKAKIKEFFGIAVRLTGEKSNELSYGLTDYLRNQVEEQSVTKSIEVIRNRIDEFGVTEPEIVSQGAERIVVQLPGVKDISRAKELIGKTAKLEFKLVNTDKNPAEVQQWVDKEKEKGLDWKPGERFSDYLYSLNLALKKKLPKGYEVAFMKKTNKITGEVTEMVPMLVESNPQITGDDLQDANVAFKQQNQPYVAITLKPTGAKRFETLTEKNVGKILAIVLDGNIYSTPRIREAIAGGRASIELGAQNYQKALQEAKDISLVLRAGALPVQLDFEEQRIVGPGLGADSIEKAKKAALIGCILVFMFIAFYYRISGGIALFTLVTNIFIVLAALVGVEATLTLPGIAGIALTIGMAVDANIIIYERIREEIRKGASSIKAMEGGFHSAFWTILDANITTALAGLCLLSFGTGPIRGFAVTLLIGIVATIYSSYFVGNLIFEYYAEKSQKTLSI